MKKRKKKLKKELKGVLKKYGDSLDWFEDGELRSWVVAGNSPLDNPESILHPDGTPLDFIEWHRAARWMEEKTEFKPWCCFDGLQYLIKEEFQPHSKKEAITHLHRMQDFFGEELNSFIRFLNSENLMDRYEEFKLLENGVYREELPFL